MSYLPVEDAIARITQCLTPLHAMEPIPILNAEGRTLAKAVYSPIPIPPFTRSAMDGYALQSHLTPGTFHVSHDIAAGESLPAILNPGQAARILTGAPLPQGADTVIEQEQIVRQYNEITVVRPFPPERNITFKGTERTQGTIVSYPGQYLDPLYVGLFASLGLTEVFAYQRPRALLLTTGDELTVPGTPLKDGHIYNSNHFLFTALLEAAGFDVTAHHVGDDIETIAHVFDGDLSQYSLVLSTGGVSVGDRDFVIAHLKHRNLLFWRTDMHPGKSIAAACLNHVPVIALSGNPGAALISWYVLVLPVIARLYQAELPIQKITGRLSHPYPKKTRETRYLRARIRYTADGVLFDAQLPQGSDIMTSYATTDALAVIPHGSGTLPRDSILTGLLVPGLGNQRLTWRSMKGDNYGH